MGFINVIGKLRRTGLTRNSVVIINKYPCCSVFTDRSHKFGQKFCFIRTYNHTCAFGRKASDHITVFIDYLIDQIRLHHLSTVCYGLSDHIQMQWSQCCFALSDGRLHDIIIG